MAIDMTAVQSYSSVAHRSFKTFIGELTAVAAGVYVGIQEVLPRVQELDATDPWKVAAGSSHHKEWVGRAHAAALVSAEARSPFTLEMGLFVSMTASLVFAMIRLVNGD